MDWTVIQLKKFAADRQIVGRKQARRKVALVKLLEAADRNWSFPQFMSLPPEIRRFIFEAAFLQIGPVRRDPKYHKRLVAGPYLNPPLPDSGSRTAFGDGNGPFAEHALTRVSRSIRIESLPVFYATRRFEMSKSEEITELHWLRYVSANKMSDMRNFYLPLARGYHLNINLQLNRDPSYKCWVAHPLGDDTRNIGPGSIRDKVVVRAMQKIEKLSADRFDAAALVELRKSVDGLVWGHA